MGEFKKIDRPCKRCGVMLYGVYPGTLYCEKCRAEIHRKKEVPETDTVPKKLTLRDVMREADKEGLQYASYCKKHGLY